MFPHRVHLTVDALSPDSPFQRKRIMTCALAQHRHERTPFIEFDSTFLSSLSSATPNLRATPAAFAMCLPSAVCPAV